MLRIKSFRVPELFEEIPETATVGSLKVHPSLHSLIPQRQRFNLLRLKVSSLLDHGHDDSTLSRDSTHESEPSLADDLRALVPVASAVVLTPNRKFKSTEQQQAMLHNAEFIDPS
ncbi:hypothetical protein Bca52824_001004 [Brassica carinata]|uniref:Telomere repeat-binding protein 1-6-like ubiquitin-like domain-containing protein n=1 Tax=Brassica carinata TaxID=52824 RepID=A0A8X7WHI0_BRACI|nr:hypothetical protein Bca52824_001004 [Brassica carinata]